MEKLIRLEIRTNGVRSVLDSVNRGKILAFPGRPCRSLELVPDWTMSSDFPVLTSEQIFLLENDPEARVMLRALYRSKNPDSSYNMWYLGTEVKSVLGIIYTTLGLQRAIDNLVNTSFAERYNPDLDFRRYNARRSERVKLKPHFQLGRAGARELISILEQYANQDRR